MSKGEAGFFLLNSISSSKSSHLPHASQPKQKPLDEISRGVGGEPHPPSFWEVRFLPLPPRAPLPLLPPPPQMRWPGAGGRGAALGGHVVGKKKKKMKERKRNEQKKNV